MNMMGNTTSMEYLIVMSNRLFYLFQNIFSYDAQLNSVLSIIYIGVIRGIKKMRLGSIFSHASPINQCIKKDMEVKINKILALYGCFITFECSEVTMLITPI